MSFIGGGKKVPLTLGIGGEVIGTAVIDDDGFIHIETDVELSDTIKLGDYSIGE